MSITEFGADEKKLVPGHLDETTKAPAAAMTAAAGHPVMAAAADHPAVKVAAASHPAVAALIASHPGVQANAPHVSSAAEVHVAAQGGPAHPAVAANHPAVKKAAESHPAVAALIASHPQVARHAPEVARRAAAHAERHGWSPHDGHAFRHERGSPWYRGWGWAGGGFAASHYWPWHWGDSRPGRPHRHHWWTRLRGWWTGEPIVEDIDVYDLPSPEEQTAAYQAVDNYDGVSDDIDLDDSGSGEGGGAGTNNSIGS
ncbi:MAG: hypothetical protein ACHREM_16690 [Polyangiales bacterium]